MAVKEEAQKLLQGLVVNLLHIQHATAGSLYYSTSSDDVAVTIDHDSISYLPRQFVLSGFKVRASGSLPRPILTIDNTDRSFFALIENNDDLLGATVVYREVYRENLDDGTDPDTAEIITRTEYIIRTMEQISNKLIRFRLATPLDAEQAKFGRIMLRHVCPRNYRSPQSTADDFYDVNDPSVHVDCPYVGSSYFDKAGNVVGSWQDDDCGQRLSDCTLRFGETAELPYKGFPSIGDPNA